MAEVTVFTAEHTQEIYDATVVEGEVNGSGHLILTTHGGTDLDAGLVKGTDGTNGTNGADGTDGADGADGAPGPPASIGTAPPSSPVTGQIWYDTSILSGLTDRMAAANPTSSTANWLALGFGYDTGITFSIAGGGCTHTYSTTGNHLGGIALASLTPGNSYLIIAKLFVPTGSPDVNLGVGFKTSSHLMKVKNQDVTVMQNFIADDTGAYFGIESTGATGSVIVKSFQVYEVNARGLPCYIYNGTEWQETVSMGAKGDVYSRVNTFGNQTAAGEKTWTGKAKFAPATDVVPVTIVRGTDTAPSAKLLDIQNHAGTSLAYFDYNGGLGAATVAAAYALFTAMDTGTLRATTCVDISSTDLNSLAYTGWFRGSSLTNSPSGSGTYYIESMIIDSNNALQRASSAATVPAVFLRTKISGTWGAWKCIFDPFVQGNGYQGSNASASSTTFAALSPGLEMSFVAPYSGEIWVTIFNDISMSGTAAGVGSYEIRTASGGGGSVFQAADDIRSTLYAGAAGRVSGSCGPILTTGLTPGTTYYIRTMGRNGTGTGAATFNVRRIMIQSKLT